ncbi:MAG: ROK family protein, partial [Spirochaetaceae bacterium]|nr:ROK family protein [Spirochaetaceae bacterium]
MSDPSNPLRAADVRERNEKIVLRLIHGAGGRGLSQSEAVIATGLRAPTIFRIFSSLEAAGYVRPLEASLDEEGRAERKGRPRVSYAAVRDALYSIGVEFWVETISIGVFDFLGERVHSRLVPVPKGADAAATAARIAAEVEDAIRELKLDRGRILGVGLGAPGQVNVRRREIAFYSRIPGMRDFPVAAVLEAALGLPVSVHNNCSVVALAESRYGRLP